MYALPKKQKTSKNAHAYIILSRVSKKSKKRVSKSSLPKSYRSYRLISSLSLHSIILYLYDEMNGLPLRRAVEPLNLEALGVKPAEEAKRRHLADDV